MHYFDHAASSPIYPEVLETLSRSERDEFANPGAMHILGHALLEKIEDYRGDFLKALGASKFGTVYFTSSATESNNTVIKGLNFEAGDIVLFSKADHPSVSAPLINLAGQFKIELKEISLLSDGSIDDQKFTSLLTNEKIRLVVFSHVNNQSGVIHDIEKLARMVKEKTDAHVHIDAVQSFGKINLKINSDIDSVSFSSHKIGGPKGIAGLYLKNGHKVKPLLLGGGQENGFRSGTVAYPLIAGFHHAMKISFAEKEQSFLEASAMNEMLRSSLAAHIPSIQLPFKTISPYIVSFILPGVSSDIILRHLEMREVFISSTSACSSKISGFKPSLFAMNIPEQYHKNFLRVSLGPRTKMVEVEFFLKEFINVWDSLKHIR